MNLADLYRADTATWRSAYDPESTLANITRSYSRWGYYRQQIGSTVRIVPRGRGVPVFKIDITATPAAGGSEIDTVVTPNTPVVARGLVSFFVAGVVGVIMALAGAQLRFLFFDSGALLVIGCGGTFVSGMQFLGMGVARRSASRRLASALAASGVVSAPPQRSPVEVAQAWPTG